MRAVTVERLPTMRLSPVDRFVLVYDAVVLFLILAFGHDYPGSAQLVAWHLAVAAAVVVLALWNALFEGPVSSFLRFAYPFLLLGFVHFESGMLNHLIVPEFLDPVFVHLDEVVFGTQLYAELAPRYGSLLLTELMNASYFSFYLIIAGVALSTWFLKREKASELVFGFTVAMWAHFFVFILLPVVGPTHLRAEIFVGAEGPITRIVSSAVEGGDNAGGAFPSSHVAGAVFLHVFVLRHFGRKPALALIPVTGLLAVSTVYLSMHYAVDVLAGLGTGLAFAAITPRLHARIAALGKQLAMRDQLAQAGD